MTLAVGEAYHSCEAKDMMADRESLLAVDGVTDRADCDANYDFDNANKLNLIPVSCFSSFSETGTMCMGICIGFQGSNPTEDKIFSEQKF